MNTAKLDEQAAQTYLMRAQDILSGEVLAAYEEVRAWLQQDMVFAAIRRRESGRCQMGRTTTISVSPE